MILYATIYWVGIWGLLGFGLPEGIALGTGHPQWTLSDTVWRLFDVLPGQTPVQWSILHFALFMFMTWLWVHFVLQGVRVWHSHKTGGG